MTLRGGKIKPPTSIIMKEGRKDRKEFARSGWGVGTAYQLRGGNGDRKAFDLTLDGIADLFGGERLEAGRGQLQIRESYVNRN